MFSEYRDTKIHFNENFKKQQRRTEIFLPHSGSFTVVLFIDWLYALVKEKNNRNDSKCSPSFISSEENFFDGSKPYLQEKGSIKRNALD